MRYRNLRLSSHQTISHYVLENVANGLKLCVNGVNVVSTVHDMFKNFMDGLGLVWKGRVL